MVKVVVVQEVRKMKILLRYCLVMMVTMGPRLIRVVVIMIRAVVTIAMVVEQNWLRNGGCGSFDTNDQILYRGTIPLLHPNFRHTIQ